jgi:hypothetical protein
MPDRRWLAGIAAAGSGGVGAVAALLIVSWDGGSVRPWLVVAIAVTVALVAVGVLALAAMQPAYVPELRRPKRVRTDRERGGTEQAARLLDKSMRDPGRFGELLRPQLVELAAHRLRRRHGVDFRRDPDRARDLVGDSLWQLMATPQQNTPSYQQLGDWVARIEAL